MNHKRDISLMKKSVPGDSNRGHYITRGEDLIRGQLEGAVGKKSETKGGCTFEKVASLRLYSKNSKKAENGGGTKKLQASIWKSQIKDQG